MGGWGEKGKVCTDTAMVIRVNNHVQTFIPRWLTPHASRLGRETLQRALAPLNPLPASGEGRFWRSYKPGWG
ncbi:hypothetical protein SAMD00079811_21330 [Scytonema sp. HK-05]|nr:hypothetical protein NIES2130_19015 [Scytonema sp. HK-05]BAY44533.1 hypothetical protein SAMD00079811_21330 [Scytonema sp. HK-05]